MSKQSLMKAVDILNGQSGLAEAIRNEIPGSKVIQGHVWKWLNICKTEMPPAEYVIPICKVTGWQVIPHELRPDIYPHPLDGMPKQEEVA